MILASKDTDNSAASEILETMADLIGTTYGPNGSLVAITRDGRTSVTKDGVTVLNAIQADSPFETAIIEIIKEASVNTMSRAGDGTTATIILANALVAEGVDLSNSAEFLSNAKQMLEKFAIKDPSKDMLMRLALTSCNWDEDLAETIVEAVGSANAGSIVATPNFGGKTELSVADKIDVYAGIVAPEFVENIAESETVMDNPKILVSLSRLEGESDIIDMVDKVISMEEENVVILIPGAEMKSIAALKINHLHGMVKILPVMVGTISGNDNADALFDLSVSVGATALGTASGKSLSTLKNEDFGSAKKVTYSKGRLIIESPEGNIEKREALASSYLVAAGKETVELVKEVMRRRSSLVLGKSIEVKIGGENKSSVMEKKDRADDTIQAVQNSIKHGVLPGGGMAYTYLSKQEFSLGYEKALMYPLSILSGSKALALNFELYKEAVCFSVQDGIVGISSENAPLDSLSTVISVLEQAVELAKLIKSIKATVISNTAGAK